MPAVPGAGAAFLSVAQLSSVAPVPGRVSVAGYASLMDEASARETMPSLSDFRHGWIDGYCRIFNLVSIVNIRRGLATGTRLATCTARARPGSQLRVCIFDIPLEELLPLATREARLRLEPVPVSVVGGAESSALLCLESSDLEYRERWCGAAGAAGAYEEQVGQHYDGPLYREDLQPVPAYMLKCLRAHAAVGTVDNFLDASFLGDGRIPLREYVGNEVARARDAVDSAESVWSPAELEELQGYLSGLSVARD